MSELRRRTKLFSYITGTQQRPRADTETALKIFHAMILPVTLYAPTVTCLRTKRQFEEQDVVLRKAARLAIHAPATTLNDYTAERANLQPSQDRTVRLAKNYVMDEKRSKTVTELLSNYSDTDSIKIKTPINHIRH